MCARTFKNEQNTDAHTVHTCTHRCIDIALFSTVGMIEIDFTDALFVLLYFPTLLTLLRSLCLKLLTTQLQGNVMLIIGKV